MKTARLFAVLAAMAAAPSAHAQVKVEGDAASIGCFSTV